MSPKPLSAARLEANRANAKKSTGPRTAAGKRRSCLNGTTHGLTARDALLPSDDGAAHQQFAAALIADLRPATPYQLQLCRNIADAHWRLSRIRSVEDGMFVGDAAPGPDPTARLLASARAFLHHSTSFANITLYEQRIHRTIKTSMEELRRLQTGHEAILQRDMPRAIQHYKEHEMRNLAGDSTLFDPSADGFAFSTLEIETAIRRRLREIEVAAAVQCHFNLAEFEKYYPPLAA